MNPVFSGTVTKGKLVFDQPENWLVHISKMEGKRVKITVAQVKNTRSLNQNSYYWGVVVPILADYCGYTHDEMHDAMRIKFLSIRSTESAKLSTIRSTSKLTTSEFADFVDQIMRWAATDLSVYIPSPGEVSL
jgi:hypothetical protein